MSVKLAKDSPQPHRPGPQRAGSAGGIEAPAVHPRSDAAPQLPFISPLHTDRKKAHYPVNMGSVNEGILNVCAVSPGKAA
jgi:hypothetical protein